MSTCCCRPSSRRRRATATASSIFPATIMAARIASRPRPSSMPAARAISRPRAARRPATATTARSISAPWHALRRHPEGRRDHRRPTRRGGAGGARARQGTVQQGQERRHAPAAVGRLVCYLASEDYDPRDTRSMSAAERRGREQAWAYLDVIRGLPGCAGAYLASTGPEFGTRESRHIDAVRQLTWQDVVDGAGRCPTASRSAPGASNGTTARPSRAASSIRPTRAATRSRSAA